MSTKSKSTPQDSPPAASKKSKKAHSPTNPASAKGVGGDGGSGVMSYLRSHLPRSSLLELYTDEGRGRYVCRAVLQRLPETSQQVIIRLSCCGGSFSRSALSIWTKYKNPAREKRDVDELYQWAIIQEIPGSTSSEITLTDEFFQCLKNSLQSLDASPWTALTQEQMDFLEQEATRVMGKPVKFPAMTPEDLEKYTQDQWDAVLHYLVGTPNMQVQPNPAITHFLLETNLMQPDPDFHGSDPDDAALVITQKGYDFMLQDNAQQVWHFVMQYLKSMETHAKAQALQKEALLVLICLSFARFGECYSAASLSKDGRVIMKDLALFGLLYVKKVGKTSVFYPTRIAMQLVGNTDGGASGSSGGGMWTLSSKALDAALAHPRPHDSSHLAILVQTNFQLCAYTTSELHVSMLGLFCEVQSIRRLPNCVFMTITRDSVKSAFALGIQAQQILRFLEKHAHPKLRQGTASPVPGNIADQVFLWDRERHRLTVNEVFMHQCMLHGEFQAVKKFAFGLDAHVWSSENRNQLFLRYKHADRVQTFVRAWRAKAAAS
jgi:transcription initiation factor TFIIH subunit 4